MTIFHRLNIVLAYFRGGRSPGFSLWNARACVYVCRCNAITGRNTFHANLRGICSRRSFINGRFVTATKAKGQRDRERERERERKRERVERDGEERHAEQHRTQGTGNRT